MRRGVGGFGTPPPFTVLESCQCGPCFLLFVDEVRLCPTRFHPRYCNTRQHAAAGSCEQTLFPSLRRENELGPRGGTALGRSIKAMTCLRRLYVRSACCCCCCC